MDGILKGENKRTLSQTSLLCVMRVRRGFTQQTQCRRRCPKLSDGRPSAKRHAARKGSSSKSSTTSLPEQMIDLYNSVRFQHDLWNYRVTRNSMLARNSQTRWIK